MANQVHETELSDIEEARDSSPSATQNQPQVQVLHPIVATQNQPQVQVLHPIVVLLRDLELGRHILVLIVPLAAMIFYNPNSNRLVDCLTIVCLCIGFAATWNGILLREMFPPIANAMEQLGIAFIFLAFFGLVSCSLPPTLVWVPGLCWVLSLLPFVLAFLSQLRESFKN